MVESRLFHHGLGRFVRHDLGSGVMHVVCCCQMSEDGGPVGLVEKE